MSLLDSLKALVGNAAAKLLPKWQTPLVAAENKPCDPDRPDVRAVALDALRDYLAAVEVVGPDGRTFHVPKSDVLEAAADDPGPGGELSLPALGMSGAPAELDTWAPDIDDDSYGIRGPNTALAWSGFYTERLALEIWAQNDSERKAVLAAVRRAFTPSENAGMLVLEPEPYFGQGIRYLLVSSQAMDDAEAVRGRVRALLVVEIDAPIVELVRMVRLDPRPLLDVHDPQVPAS